MLCSVLHKGWCLGGVGGVRGCLVPDAEEGVPGARGDGHAVLGDAEAGHSVVVPC